MQTELEKEIGQTGSADTPIRQMMLALHVLPGAGPKPADSDEDRQIWEPTLDNMKSKHSSELTRNSPGW